VEIVCIGEVPSAMSTGITVCVIGFSFFLNTIFLIFGSRRASFLLDLNTMKKKWFLFLLQRVIFPFFFRAFSNPTTARLFINAHPESKLVYNPQVKSFKTKPLFFTEESFDFDNLEGYTSSLLMGLRSAEILRAILLHAGTESLFFSHSWPFFSNAYAELSRPATAANGLSRLVHNNFAFFFA
jgi:hypothetical protein